jgi:prepilin-type processing-associated H-X9-DG protein
MVEILVTTAIMGILAALLVSSLRGVANRGKDVKCISNLRQVGIGLMAHAAENDGNLPWATVKDGTALGNQLGLSGDYMWSKQLGPYLPQRGNGASLTAQQNEVFVCPAAKYQGFGLKTISSTYNSSSTLFHFPPNASAAHLGVAGGDVDVPPRKLVTVQNPSATILVAEGRQSGSAGSCASSVRWDQANADLQQASPSGMTYLDFRHSEKMNVVYADGHVGTVAFKDRAQILRPNWEGRNY